ncbi:MAG: hypothetical protein IJF12_02175 [Alphaproteobacteria bacterium]|nr:hypothetical protein [Alphaproteobacteria bacterium]
MRKYFLLSAVALMISGTANATTDYAEVTAKATIEVANILSCTEMDWGKIVVKDDNEGLVIDSSCASTSDDLISVSKNDMSAKCTVPASGSFSDSDLDGGVFSDITLTGTKGGTLTVTEPYMVTQDTFSAIYANLNIPANVVADEYTGSFTFTYTYE